MGRLSSGLQGTVRMEVAMGEMCYSRAMRKRRGVALISSLLVVMSVYLMVTVMVANMQVELRATRLDGKAVQDRYKARAACAEMSLLLSNSRGMNWTNYTRDHPYRPAGYDPPVLVWFSTDPRTSSLLHMHVQCGQEFSIKVFRKSGIAEAQIFSALVAPDGGMRLHSLAMSDVTTRTTTGEQAGDNAFSPWTPIVNPPALIYDSGGELIDTAGGPANRYVADMRGGLYATLSSEQGFGLYKYAGGQAWNRMPARPAMSFSPVTGSLTPTGSSYLGSQARTPVWDVGRDGGKVWFAENVDSSPAAPSGASYLQAYDTSIQEWQSLAVPALPVGPGPAQRFRIKDVAAGEEGQVFLLTEPTATRPARVVRFRDGAWSVLPEPPRRYFLADNATLVNQPGTLPIESIAVGTDNTLFACGPAGPDLYTVSSYSASWDLGLERGNRSALLPSRNFSAAGGYRPMSVDAAGKVIMGSQSAANNPSAAVVRGNRDERVYTALPSLLEKANPGETVWSNIGGGVQGTTTSTFRATAEF